MTRLLVETAEDDLQQEKRSFRGDIQGLRAVAVLVVVASHAQLAGFAGGFVGVDVFFVISGFLITGLLVREARSSRHISIADFYARRARRIIPAATLVLLVTCLAGWFLLGAVRMSDLLHDVEFASIFAANWKFAADGTDYFTSVLPPSAIQHFWSLAVEEQFYLVWPALLGLILFASRHPRLRHYQRRRARLRRR